MIEIQSLFLTLKQNQTWREINAHKYKPFKFLIAVFIFEGLFTIMLTNGV